MFGSVVSRWTMLHFWAAFGLFALAQAAMALGFAYPDVPLFAPTTLAVVHLLTIGWITVLMLGALHQFLPVITAQRIVAGRSALISLVAILGGLCGMEAGFLAMGGVLPMACLICLPVGGTLVLVGLVTASGVLARILWRTRPLPFSARFVAVGLVFLLVTAAMGIVMGLVFAYPDLVPWPEALSTGFHLHLLAGLVGWFTLTAIGVSYRLLSMFTLAPEERGGIGTAVFVLSAGGTAAAWLIGLANAAGLAVPGETAALGAAATGVALYFVDMIRLYRARRRRKLELNTSMAVPPLAAFAACLVGVLAIAAGDDAFIGPVAYLFIFGWLSGLGLSQLYKIVPFLTWLQRYGHLLGKQDVPRVQDLVDEHRDRPWFWLYFAAVAFGFLAGLAGWTLVWRLAIATHLAATLMIARALWLARRPQAPTLGRERPMGPRHFGILPYPHGGTVR
ncbi:MAG: hypothetical protein KGJ78_07835 [Alphaproteobacteria bacterium]|nr:hypothetical protein [Alphaproteobacteria bacterium]